MKLEYFKTSSSKCNLDLQKKLEQLNGNKTEKMINRCVETNDDTISEANVEYQVSVLLPFTNIKVEEI